MPTRAGSTRSRPSRCSSTWPLSSTLPKRAAAPTVMRSAMASTSTPPSACASKPCSATGRPACSVAPRSRPPSKAVSPVFKGTRLNGLSAGNRVRKSDSHSSRAAQAGARKATPPKPAGSTANRAAIVAASPCMAKNYFPGAAASSASARSTRVDDPASSSGLRRKR